MTRLLLLPTVLALWLGHAPADAAPSLDGVVVTIEPTSQSVVLGENIDLTVTVTNTADRPTVDLVAHLDITDPAQSRSVDPEDWTSTLSQPVGVLAPGGSVTATWNIQPIASGDFAVYAVAITADASTLVASNVLKVTVADQRTLNPGGILPVAIGAPTAIGALLLFQTRASRRARGAARS